VSRSFSISSYLEINIRAWVNFSNAAVNMCINISWVLGRVGHGYVVGLVGRIGLVGHAYFVGLVGRVVHGYVVGLVGRVVHGYVVGLVG